MRHVYETGAHAIPIVALIAFLMRVIIAYMGTQQLQKFGADIFVVDLVTVGVLRELGTLLTAIIVAGYSGGSIGPPFSFPGPVRLRASPPVSDLSRCPSAR